MNMKKYKNLQLVIKHYKLLILTISILQIILILSACSSSNQNDKGVARIEKTPTPIATGNIKGFENISEPQSKTDEEIVTQFTTCIREHGITVPDPELNSDGTVDFHQLRESIFNNAAFQQLGGNGSARQELQKCFSILGNTTFAEEREQEDPIELQDDLLQLAQCLRDNGLDVPDPDFSDGPRASMRPIVSSLNSGGIFGSTNVYIENDQVAEILRTCTDNIFSGAQIGNQGGGRSAGSRR